MLRLLIYALWATFMQLGVNCHILRWNVTNIWQDWTLGHDHPHRPSITEFPRFTGIPHFTRRPGRHTRWGTYTPLPEVATSISIPASLSELLVVPISATSLTSTGEDTSTLTSRRTSTITETTFPTSALVDEPSTDSFISLPDFTLTRGTLTTRVTRTRTSTVTQNPAILSDATTLRKSSLTSDGAVTSGLIVTPSAFITSSPFLATSETLVSPDELTPVPVSSSFSTSIPSSVASIQLSAIAVSSSFSTSIPTPLASLELTPIAVFSSLSTSIPAAVTSQGTLVLETNVGDTGSLILPNTIIGPSSTSATSASTPLRTTIPRSGFVNGAYFVNWGTYERNYYPNDLPVKQLTHVYYAFALQHANGVVTSTDPQKDAICIQQLRTLKQDNPQLKVILSIGGWNASQDESFNTLAASPGKRYIFASSAVHMMQSYGFDGIDIDWEYPKTNTDGANFLAVLKELRDALDTLGGLYNHYHFLLTAACPGGPSNYRLWPLAAMSAYLDYFNFMGYDYMGAGYSSTSGHHANLVKSVNNPSSTAYDTESAVDDYIRAGVPPGKIVLGMPAYGRSFSATVLGRAYKLPARGSWVDPATHDGLGVWDYKSLPRRGAREYYARDAGATYSYNAATGELISYDTPGMVSKKLDYVLSMKLAGAYFWEASADRPDDGATTTGRSLIRTSADKLRNAGGLDTSPNHVYSNCFPCG